LPNRQVLETHRLVEVGVDLLICLTEGTKYFFLSIVGISVRSAFSQMTYGSMVEVAHKPCTETLLTGMRSGYFCRILSASAFRLSALARQPCHTRWRSDKDQGHDTHRKGAHP
jgi:hypothetical protein